MRKKPWPGILSSRSIQITFSSPPAQSTSKQKKIYPTCDTTKMDSIFWYCLPFAWWNAVLSAGSAEYCSRTRRLCTELDLYEPVFVCMLEVRAMPFSTRVAHGTRYSSQFWNIEHLLAHHLNNPEFSQGISIIVQCRSAYY